MLEPTRLYPPTKGVDVAIVTLSVLSLVLAGLATAIWMTSRKRAQSLSDELTKATEQARELELDKVRLQTELQTLKDKHLSELNSIEAAKKSMEDSFKSLASQALEGSNKQFLQLAKATLEKEASVAQSDLEKRQTSIETLVKPLKEQLDKYHAHVGEVEKSRVSTYSMLDKEIRKLADSHVTLSQETKALKDALKKPHVRGRWGEVQLKNCIELAGMSEYADVSFQDSSTDIDGKQLRPDMTVRMPGGHTVVVDAKTPIDAFLGSLEATTDEERNTEMARHGRHVKDHVKKLSSKAYNDAIEGSADFTVMFLPNESFLYAALEAEADLVEYALQHKILIATPPTLVGLLKVIRFGWNEEKLAENAAKISDAGKELHKRVVDFVTAYTNVGKHLDKAKEEFETGLTRLNSRVLVQAKRLENLGAKSSKSLPEGLGEGPDEDLAIEETREATVTPLLQES